MEWKIYLRNGHHFTVDATPEEIKSFFKSKSEGVVGDFILKDGRWMIVDGNAISHAIAGEKEEKGK